MSGYFLLGRQISPTLAWTSHQGQSLRDKSVGLQPKYADFFFFQPSGKNEVASFCVSEVRRENIIGDFFLPLTNQRNGEADSRSSVPLQEHHWATHYKKSRIPSGATSKRTCFPSSLILCVDDCFPIYALIYPRDLSRVSRAAFSLANPPVGHRSFGGEGWRRKRATEWGRLLSPSTPCSPFVSLAQ